MILWYVALVLAGLFLLILLMLWLPFRVEVDTETDLYRMEWGRVASGQWIPGPDGGSFLIRAPFFRRQLSVQQLFEPDQSKKPQTPTQAKPAQKPKLPRRRMSFQQSMQVLARVVRTIHIHHCRIMWDTDDFVLNAWLVPVFMFVRKRNFQVEVNFQGKHELALLMETRPLAVIWVLFKQFIIKQ